jgi:hypothetical protein
VESEVAPAVHSDELRLGYDINVAALLRRLHLR